jgi:hypothetical protein
MQIVESMEQDDAVLLFIVGLFRPTSHDEQQLLRVSFVVVLNVESGNALRLSVTDSRIKHRYSIVGKVDTLRVVGPQTHPANTPRYCRS